MLKIKSYSKNLFIDFDLDKNLNNYEEIVKSVNFYLKNKKGQCYLSKKSLPLQILTQLEDFYNIENYNNFWFELKLNFISKKDEVNLVPTKEIAEEAEKGLELRKKYNRGGTAVGVARARDLKNRKSLSIRTLKRMKAFFDRHSAFKEHHKDKSSAAYISWLLWGGDAARDWVERKLKELDSKDS